MSLSGTELRLTVQKVSVLAAFKKYQKYRGHIWVTFANIQGLELDKIQFNSLEGFSFPFRLNNNSAHSTSCVVEIDIHKNGYSQKIGEGIFHIDFPKNRAFFEFQCSVFENPHKRSEQKQRMMVIGVNLMENYEQLGYHGAINETLEENYSDEEMLGNFPRVKRRRLYTFHNRTTDNDIKKQKMRTEESPQKLKLKQIEAGNLVISKSNKEYPDFLQPACLSINHSEQNFKSEDQQFTASKQRIQSKFRRIYSFSQSNTQSNAQKKYETLPKISERKQSMSQRTPKVAPSKAKRNLAAMRILKIQKVYFEQSENFLAHKKNSKSKLFEDHLKKYLQFFHKQELVYQSGGSSGKQTEFWIMRDCCFVLNQLDQLVIRVYQKKAPLVNFVGNSSISYQQFIVNSQHTNQVQRFVMRNEQLNGILSVFFQISSLEDGLKNQKRNVFSTQKNHSECSKGYSFGNPSYCPYHFQSPTYKQEQIMPHLKEREHKRKTLKKPTKKLYPSSQNQIGNETLVRRASEYLDTLY